MTEFRVVTFCADCKNPLNTSEDTPETRAPCPKCGSTKRRHQLSAHIEGGGARIAMGLSAKHPGQKKPHVELKMGPSHSRQLDKPVEHERLIDRANDRYFEKVTNYESGELIHHADEPLSEHRGHGSAKKERT
jgi:hypothetical protein